MSLGKHRCCVLATVRLDLSHEAVAPGERRWTWRLLLSSDPDTRSTHYAQVSYCPWCGESLPARPPLALVDRNCVLGSGCRGAACEGEHY